VKQPQVEMYEKSRSLWIPGQRGQNSECLRFGNQTFGLLDYALWKGHRSVEDEVDGVKTSAGSLGTSRMERWSGSLVG